MRKLRQLAIIGSILVATAPVAFAKNPYARPVSLRSDWVLCQAIPAHQDMLGATSKIGMARRITSALTGDTQPTAGKRPENLGLCASPEGSAVPSHIEFRVRAGT